MSQRRSFKSENGNLFFPLFKREREKNVYTLEQCSAIPAYPSNANEHPLHSSLKLQGDVSLLIFPGMWERLFQSLPLFETYQIAEQLPLWAKIDMQVKLIEQQNGMTCWKLWDLEVMGSGNQPLVP